MILSKLTLAGREPLLLSKTRRVFEHPEDNNLLVKVHISRRAQPGDRGLKAWLANRQDHFLYTTGILRELQQFVESRYRDYGEVVAHIAPIYGVIDTDLGLGLLMAAVRDGEGQLAPTVRRLFREKAMNSERCDKLNRLLSAIESTSLVIGDLNQENIVLQDAGLPSERFVLIDGLGERTWIPTQRWFSFIGARQKRHFVAKVRAKLERLAHG
ncbi:MAG: YrbL family protein [Saccharospirillum sp.]